MYRKKACVVLPTYNEAGNVPILIPRILRAAEHLPEFDLHVLVVDDASPDGTAREVERLSRRHPEVSLLCGRKQGIGEAYQRGMAHALTAFDPDLIVQMDADLQHDPSLLPSLILSCDSGYDVAIGSRLVPGGSLGDIPWVRRVLSRLGNRLLRLLISPEGPRDCTSGFRCIRADLLNRIDSSTPLPRGHAFLWVFLQSLLQVGDRTVQVQEIPMQFHPRGHGKSKLGVRMALDSATHLVRCALRRSRTP